jgi:hypothetical protein
MGNTCQLPLLTPSIPEIGAGRVKSATAGDYFAKCERCSPQSIDGPPQDVHSSAMLSSCRNRRFGCRVEDTTELLVIDCNL